MTNTGNPTPPIAADVLDEAQAQPAASIPVATTAQARAYGWELIKQHRRGFVAMTSWQLVTAAAAAASPWIIGRLVGQLSANTATTTTVNYLMVGLLAATVVQAVATWLGLRAATQTSEDVFRQVRENFMRAVTRLPAGLVEKTGTGDLVSRSTDDVDKLTLLVRAGIPFGVLQACMLLASLVGCLATGGWVSLVLVVTVVSCWFSFPFYFKRARAGYLRESRASARFESTLAETVQSAETVDALGLGAVRRKAHRDRLRAVYRNEFYTLRLRSIFFPIVDFGVLASAALAVAWGLWLVSHDWATVAQVTAVALYLMRMNSSLTWFAAWLDILQSGEVALARLHGVSLFPEVGLASDERPDGSVVALSSVDFAYDAGPLVLRGVSLEVTEGQRLTIVGASGSGKSTLARLIAGVERPCRGSVSLGGVPVAAVSREFRHHEVMLLTQEGHVFSASVRDNLTLALPSALDDELWRALDVVGAGWVRDFPDGLDTVVGDGAVSVDPAQAQHLALARVVLADPKVVILDEATSLVGPGSAARLERCLAGVLDGRTVISIAHQLRVAADSDRVVVMDSGRIVEDGAHEDLVAASGVYASLWKSWNTGR